MSFGPSTSMRSFSCSAELFCSGVSTPYTIRAWEVGMWECPLSLAKMSSAPKQTDSPSRTAEDETRELNQEC